MKVLFDTNVVLDLMLDREPWSVSAVQLFSRVETGTLEGFLCATTVTTIHYLAAKAVGSKRAREEIRKLLALCTVAPVDHGMLERALELEFSDVEDAVLHEAARRVEVDVIVTRDLGGLKKATIRCLAPDELVGQLELREGLKPSRDGE